MEFPLQIFLDLRKYSVFQTKGFNEGHMKYSVEELDISAQM